MREKGFAANRAAQVRMLRSMLPSTRPPWHLLERRNLFIAEFSRPVVAAASRLRFFNAEMVGLAFGSMPRCGLHYVLQLSCLSLWRTSDLVSRRSVSSIGGRQPRSYNSM